MTQRVSKAGNRYTQGSSSTPAKEWPSPMVCERCSRRIFSSRESFEQRADHLPGGVLFRQWHLGGCPAGPLVHRNTARVPARSSPATPQEPL